MAASRYNVLFLCAENSARSIFAEALLNHKAARNFRAFSAGPQPQGFLHPETVRQLERVHLPTAGLRSKGLSEFAKMGAPDMDFVFRIWDNAAQEARPEWPGHIVTGDWHVPDPTVATGTSEEIEKAFEDAFVILQRRIDLLLALPLEGLLRIAVRPRRRAAAA